MTSEHTTLPLLRRFRRKGIALTATGTAALEVALNHVGVSKGAEVIVPNLACHSVAAAVSARGGVPVFTNVGRNLVLTGEDIRRVKSSRTRAVVAVHQYGLPCDIARLRDAGGPGVGIIEDVCQTWNSALADTPSGCSGDVAVISFGPSKPVMLGAGGAVLADVGEIADLVSTGSVRDRELSKIPSSARFPMPLLHHLPEAIQRADQAFDDRQEIVEKLRPLLAKLEVRLPPVDTRSTPSWTKVPVFPIETTDTGFQERVWRHFPNAQAAHAVAPSNLPMFLNVPKVIDTAPVAEPYMLIRLNTI